MPEARQGAFVAVVGPSGAGKDTIMALAKAEMADEARVSFARRVVTRPVDIAAEDHDHLSPAAFEAAEAAGAFCLAWRAHGLAYGLPASHRGDAQRGRSVVANLSRRALADAAALFPEFYVIEITAPRALIVARIAARGREDASAIETRLARNVDIVIPESTRGHHRIDNDARAEDAAAAFVNVLRRIIA